LAAASLVVAVGVAAWLIAYFGTSDADPLSREGIVRQLESDPTRVIEALAQAEREQRTAAVELVRAISKDETLPAAVRQEAVGVLGDGRFTDGVPAKDLTELARSEDPDVAGTALGTLASTDDLESTDKDGTTLEAIIAASHRSERAAKRNAVLALARYTAKPAVARLVELLTDDDRLARNVSARRLKELGAPVDEGTDAVQDWLDTYTPGETGETDK
jgi:HEAT repeat protein